MKNNESLVSETFDPGSKITAEVQRAAIKSQLDQLFRQGGIGVEMRTLYGAVLEYRMGNLK